jgi:hypothetical protein
MLKYALIILFVAYATATCHVVRVAPGTSIRDMAYIASQGNSFMRWNLVIPVE